MRTLIACMLLLAAVAWAAPQESGRDTALAGILSDLLAQLTGTGNSERASLAFDLPQEVINAYVGQLTRSRSRPGMDSLKLRLNADSTVSFGGAVDLKQLHEWEPELFASGKPLANLERLELEAVLRFKAEEGKATVTSLTAKADAKQVSPDLAGKIVRAIVAHQPEGYDLGQPIPLPFRLERLSVSAGSLHGETR